MRLYLLSIALFVFIAALSSALAQAKYFDVEDMLALEDIGEVRFAPDGSFVLFEKVRAYEKQVEYPSGRMFDRNNMEIFIARTKGDGKPGPLLSLNGAPNWLGPFSPDGKHIVVHWFVSGQIKTGVYTFESKRLTPVEGNIHSVTESFDRSPRWVSETAIVFQSVSAARQRAAINRLAHNSNERRRLEEASWAGEFPGVTHLRTRQMSDESDVDDGQLVYFDVEENATRIMGSGDFRAIFASAKSGRFVAVEYVGKRPVRDDEDIDYENGKYDINALHLFDAYDPGASEVLCAASCSVKGGRGLRWSESGRKIAFVAYDDAPAFKRLKLFVYDVDRKTLISVTAPELGDAQSIFIDTHAHHVPNAVWLGERLVMRGTRTQRSETEDGAAYDWFAVSDDGAAARNLTAQHPAPPADYLTVWDDKLLLVNKGEILSVSHAGEWETLTAGVEQEVSPWCVWYHPWRSLVKYSYCGNFARAAFSPGTDKHLLQNDKLVLKLFPSPSNEERVSDIARAAVGSHAFGVFDLQRGNVNLLSALSSEDQLVAISPFGSPVVRRQGQDGDRLALIDSSQRQHILAHYNRHLNGVKGGTPKYMPFEREDESVAHDWLLLPPGHKEGDRHPLIVRFYPGDTGHPDRWSGYGEMRTVLFINEYILASAGYAVLVPGMPGIRYPDDVPSDTMYELHEPLIEAASRVVEAGYADPDNWFVMGHSYGGYGALSVLTQTDRFRGAIAMSGTYNLVSHYGNFDAGDVASMRTARLSKGVEWAETKQGRMGAAPWRDADRYVRNSPVFHIDAIEGAVLLIHGDVDFVDVSGAEQVFNAFNRTGKDAEFIRYWGEPHTINSPANIRHMYDNIFRWLSRLRDQKR